jgi:hypothetical protein
MKTRYTFRWLLSVVLLILATGSGLAREPQPLGGKDAAGANASPGATAPWYTETVDSGLGVGSHVSVAINQYGTTYISYYDSSNKNLMMAKYVGSGGNCGPDNDWSCLTLDSGADVGQYNSIAIDPTTNLPKIAYYDASEKALKLAKANGVWSSTTIVSSLSGSIGRYASLKIDSTGAEHIAFYYDYGPYSSLRYARYVGGGGNCGGGNFKCDIIHTGVGVGQYASLALDGSGQPRIAYYDGDNGDLWYAQPGNPGNCGPGGTWGCRLVSSTSDVGQYASLDVDNNNIPHIAYYDTTNGKLMYAVQMGGGNCGFSGSWQCDEITITGSLPIARPVSLAVDKAGYPIIAYIDNYWTGIDVRRFNWARPAAALGLQSGNCDLNNAWQCESIDGSSTGAYSAIAVNPSSGLATIAYNYSKSVFDPSELRVAYQRFHQVFLPLVEK